MTDIIRKMCEFFTNSTEKYPKTQIHIPGDLKNPDVIAVFTGMNEEDAWPSVYLANTLQKRLPDVPLVVICSRRDRELFSTLKWHPEFICYGTNYIHEDNPDSRVLTDRSILISPLHYSEKNIIRYFRKSKAGIRIAGFRDRSVNISVDTDIEIYPDYCHTLSLIIGMNPDSDWLPVVPSHHDAKASAITAPGSGRILPFMAMSSCAMNLLNRFEAEIPLRTVTLTGKNAEYPEITRETRAAIVARASAVVTTEPNLWADACALGVPVIGYDPNGTFQKWHGRFPETSKSDFIDSWNEFLHS